MIEPWNSIWNFLSPETYTPHGYCYLWQPSLVWLHAASDTITGIAYYSIPILLIYFIRQRQDVPFKGMFLLFSLFILSCGTIHFLEVWTLWHPAYWLSGGVKLITGGISIYTAGQLVPILPAALSLKSPQQLETLNEELQQQIDERLKIEASIRQLNEELEQRVAERTLELERANQSLLEEVVQRQQAELSLQELNQRLEARVNELEVRGHYQISIRELTEVLQVCLTVEEAHGILSDLLQPLFPNLSGAIYLISDCGPNAELVARWGVLEESLEVFPLEDCWALRRGIFHTANSQKPGFFCQHVRYQNEESLHTLCSPMKAQGEFTGLLFLQSNQEISGVTQEFAQRVADQVALSIANLKLRETLRNQSIRDPLTQLFNRRYMETYLQRELARAHREQTSLSLAMIDVDRFKRINDTFGHKAGDTVLVSLSQFLERNSRSYDLVCRYGGEEIALILPSTTLDVAYERVDRLREGISELVIQHLDRTLPQITVSVGIASFPENARSADDLVQLADNALYHAKASGRNCTIHIQSLNPSMLKDTNR